MNIKAVVIGASLALLALGGLIASKAHDAAVELKLANAATKAAVKRAEAAEKADSAIVAQVVVLRAQRDSALTRADQKSRLAARLTGSLASLAKAAPDTCRPIVVTADSALAADSAVIAQKDSVIAHDKQIEAKMQQDNDSLRVALTSLTQAAKVEVKAVTKQEHRSLLARLIPTPGIGIAAGFTPQGAPQVLTGITLSWQVHP